MNNYFTLTVEEQQQVLQAAEALKRCLSETTLMPGDHDRIEVDSRLVQGASSF